MKPPLPPDRKWDNTVARQVAFLQAHGLEMHLKNTGRSNKRQVLLTVAPSWRAAFKASHTPTSK